MAAGHGGRDSRRSGTGKVDGMQGSQSEGVDERGRSLVMDDDIGVPAPA